MNSQIDTQNFQFLKSYFEKNENNQEDTCNFSQVYKNQNKYLSMKWEQYLPVYDRFLNSFVKAGKPVHLLELGVQNGGSLETWKKYLPENSHIDGVDIDINCTRLNFSENINFYLGSAADIKFIEKYFANSKYDIIVDDASHNSRDIIKSFEFLFSKVNPGGFYIVEDCHASYWNTYSGGFKARGSAIEYFKELVDSLHYKYLSDERKDALGFTGKKFQQLNEEIASISFYDSMIIIEKYLTKRKDVFRNYMTEGEANVLPIPDSQNIALPCNKTTAFEKIYRDF